MERVHKSVLFEEVISMLHPQRMESYLDLTAGYGGHADGILGITQNYKDSVLVDRDEWAVKYLEVKYQEVKPKILHQSFYDAALSLLESGMKFDMILADLGLSSPQLDNSERGFSFSKDAKLDMRMDRRQDLNAWTVVNKYGVREMADIFVRYGEEKPKRAEFLARIIAEHRPINNTLELADLIQSKSAYCKIHPATRVFQAIRIEVNAELWQLQKTLTLLPRLLVPNGRVAIISFHSLEDRLVKDAFKAMSSLGQESPLKIITKKPIVAGKNEIANNPRARSAKLRVAKKN